MCGGSWALGGIPGASSSRRRLKDMMVGRWCKRWGNPSHDPSDPGGIDDKHIHTRLLRLSLPSSWGSRGTAHMSSLPGAKCRQAYHNPICRQDIVGALHDRSDRLLEPCIYCCRCRRLVLRGPLLAQNLRARRECCVGSGGNENVAGLDVPVSIGRLLSAETNQGG